MNGCAKVCVRTEKEECREMTWRFRNVERREEWRRSRGSGSERK